MIVPALAFSLSWLDLCSSLLNFPSSFKVATDPVPCFIRCIRAVRCLFASKQASSVFYRALTAPIPSFLIESLTIRTDSSHLT